MSSWKHSFKRLNEEYEITKKKKQALDNLLSYGKISKSTHELFDKEIADTVAEIEKQQLVLLEKMRSKVVELEGEIRTLEMLLANFEIQHVTGEVDEEAYQRESSLLSLGLEAARQELSIVRDALNQLSGNTQIEIADLNKPQEIEAQPTEVQVENEEKQKA